MLDIKFIRENPETVKKAILEKAIKLNLDALLELDARILALRKETEEVQAEANRVAKEIPKADVSVRGEMVAKGKELKTKLTDLEPQLRNLEIGRAHV